MRKPAISAVLALAAVCACAAPMQGSGPRRPGAAAHSRPTPPPQARIDINHASVAELMKVPGMTATWAGRIVRFRPYRAKTDLLDRGVLPSAVYDRIKDYVIAHREKR